MSRQYQIADLEKRMLKENQEDKNEELSCPSPNAALRGAGTQYKSYRTAP
ncbi:hypothetical protein [Vibrio parahaemolyticus]|nr:hypothetical protein [Vibrio parahaemolyticus]HCG5474431.1 hypothetical protein [Vibrio parahaemolyticus]